MQDPTTPSATQSNPSTSTEPSHTCTPARRRRGFLAGLIFGALAAGLVGFAVGATMPAAEAALGIVSRMGHGLSSNGGFGSDNDGPPTPEEAKEHAEFFVGFALHRLDATDDQEQRVQSIVDGAIDQLYPVVQEHHANRDEFRSVLGAPTIDRAAIEKLRAEELALADTLSRTIAAALADSAEVLSVEQRTELIERLERFHHHH
jgi:Spy/CpxP family protein refolding chaperone